MENLTAADTKKLVDKCFGCFFYSSKASTRNAHAALKHLGRALVKE